MSIDKISNRELIDLKNFQPLNEYKGIVHFVLCML